MMNLSSIANERFLFAVERYLERKGYKVTPLDDPHVDFLAVDGDEAALVSVCASEVGFEESLLTRGDYERCLLESILHELIETNTSVRFDSISICALDCERAIIRHHMSVAF